MTTDVPPDVEAVLSQLFAEAREAFENGDVETGLAAVTTAATVATNKLPEGTLRGELRHGCQRTQAAVSEEEENVAVAVEYLTVMRSRLEDIEDA